jgi:hypothetical protein
MEPVRVITDLSAHPINRPLGLISTSNLSFLIPDFGAITGSPFSGQGCALHEHEDGSWQWLAGAADALDGGTRWGLSSNGL